MTKKTIKSKTAKSTATLTNDEFLGKIRRLSVGKSVSNGSFGTVKCTKSAKDSRNGKKMFSISKSTVAQNRGNYTLDDICEAFGLSK